MTATTANHFLDTPQIQRKDWKIISLIGAAHACSHFFQLVFPTLFIALNAEFGFNYGQLGLLVAIFFVVSGVGQASSGFIVDRIGPTPVLRFGLGSFVLAGVLIGGANGYWVLVLAAIIGGLGNSVFHPVDYSILNHRVSPRRLGHAFSTHGFTGNLGWALTPVFMSALIYLANWRVAALGAAALVAVVLVFVWLGRDLLAGNNVPHAEAANAEATPGHESSKKDQSLASKSVLETLSILGRQPALWGAFFFFALTSIALSAVQNYSIPMLGQVYGIDAVLASTTLSAYMLAAALGMIGGGFLVGTNQRSEFTIAASLVVAGLSLVVLALGWVGTWGAVVVLAVGGFCSGLSTPSRDMLIRRITPKGATGTVYGLVYSGMDVGASLAPVAFGVMLDVGLLRGPWVGAAVAFVVAAFAALMIGRSVAARTA
jgi:MFS family permease